jgi:MFS family permease
MVSKKIPRTVFILGLVSFFNDLASEMIYPIVPIFLTSVLHASVPIVGFIEGFAEAVASITKYLFGTYSDYLKKRKIFVTLGYSFGALSKLLIGFAYAWPFVLFARFVDRIGKGMRTAPRDSLLLENATPENKGFIFGFHRAFDSLGAVFGPLIALLLMYGLHENLRLTFFIAAIPGFIAILLLIFLVHEKKNIDENAQKKFVKIDWSALQPKLKVFLFISFIFALGNSSDTFLLLHAKNMGLSTTLVVCMYVLYNISQTIFATPAGYLSDKFGAKQIFAGGLFVFACVYLLFGIAVNSLWLWILFPIYGVYIAATDGVSKAYISEFITKEQSGTFFGVYYTLSAVGTFFASVIGGLLWSKISPSATFIYGSTMAFLAFAVLLVSRKKLLT